MKRTTFRTLISAAAVLAALSSAASADTLFNWEVDLTSLGGGDTTGVNNLGFNGESYIVNTLTGGGNFNFTDDGVFNFTTYNGGPVLNLNGGQLTAVYSGGTGSGNLGGTFTFDAGGTLDIYFNTSTTYGTKAGNDYGASDGTQVASFTQLAGGGGQINPDGTPIANGQVQLTFQAVSLDANVWLNQLGLPLDPLLTLGFVTTNASEDLSATNCTVATCTIDPNLVTALGATIPNNPPSYFLVNNGGQLKLATIPEPSTVALFGVGLLGLGLGCKRRRKASASN